MCVRETVFSMLGTHTGVVRTAGTKEFHSNKSGGGGWGEPATEACIFCANLEKSMAGSKGQNVTDCRVCCQDNEN
jgi:hypothetical protein